MKPTTLDAYKLLQEGCIALAKVEANGIKIDEKYLLRTIKNTSERIRVLSEEIKTDKVVKVWKKRFGVETNLDSGAQLGKVLFDELKYECVDRTETGKPKTDQEALEKLDIPFVKKLLEIKKLKKAKGTYLAGVAREVSNGFVHPCFNLHLARTYRSSSDSPNFQNIPIRIPEMGKLIRQCFIPRASNRHIVEIDYGGIEVCAASWYHKDPVMLDYLADDTKDMHKDMAQQCFALPLKEVHNPVDDKDAERINTIRYCGKNMFVFPQFYGDWYKKCAPALWAAIDSLHLQTRDGRSIKEWLKHKGITHLGPTDIKSTPPPGSYIDYIRQVEDDFWNVRFKIYKKWKESWYDAYRRTGGFTTLTGFRLEGLLQKNEVINYPVQGVAFHCLLWSLIRLQKLLVKYKMKSLLIGQIHDSIVADVVDKELQNYLELAHKVMTQDIRKHWKWIITDLEVEAEVTPAGKSWHEKKKVVI